MSFGLYIHIPFCEQHCHYCAFAVAVRPRSDHEPYVDRLVSEIRLAEIERQPETLYLGGGTPSLVDPRLLGRIFESVGPVGGEISIEANPGTFDAGTLEAWRALGINRVSLGAQSFDDQDLRLAGRLHSSADIVADAERLERAGFGNVNLDLIAGLPGQDRSAWLANLDWIERLAPEHVSVYLLELDESAVWARRPQPLHGEEDHAWFYQAAADRLGAMGYCHYEISNWAREGFECRHNLGYWDQTPYRGLGLGAHSLTGSHRFWNTRQLPDYGEYLDRGELPIEDSEVRSPRVRLEETFLLGLRQTAGFRVGDIARELGFQYPQDWFDRVAFLRSAGLVSFERGILRLEPRGWLLTSGITEELLCPSLLSISEATP